MKVAYINPFVESVLEFFSAMLGAQVERKAILRAGTEVQDGNIRALIGLSGSIIGTVVLILPMETAQSIVRAFLSMDEQPDTETLRDGVAEAVNIIAGNAKARLPHAQDATVALSLPTVITGNGVNVDYPTSAVWIEIPFESTLGAFSLRVAFQSNLNENLGV